MDRSKKMPCGGLSPVTLLAIVMAVVTSPASQYQCRPPAIKPNVNDIEVRNVASKHGRVVANMAGYLELLGNTTTYLSLNTRTIYNAKYGFDQSKHSLVMYDDYVQVRIEYHDKDGGNFYEFTKIEMSVYDATPGFGSHTEICRFDGMFFFSMPVDSRYSCQRVISHKCSDKNARTVANLVLKSLEIELDGDQKMIAKREFGKPAWEESCDHWSGSAQAI